VGAAPILTPPDEAKVIETSAGPVWIEDDGIVRQAFRVEVIRIEHMEEIFAAIMDVGGTEGHWRVLVDLRSVRWGTRGARDYAAGRSLADLVDAQALLVASPVTRMVANFFVRVSQPPFPIRVFDSITRAFDWLSLYDRSDPSNDHDPHE
jgi:hypothetical protein